MIDMLTPYDKGDVAEPRPWTHATREDLVEAPLVQRVLLEERFGKVDFDDSESITLATVWLERTDEGQHVLHVQPLAADVILVQVHG